MPPSQRRRHESSGQWISAPSQDTRREWKRLHFGEHHPGAAEITKPRGCCLLYLFYNAPDRWCREDSSLDAGNISLSAVKLSRRRERARRGGREISETA